MINFLIMTQLIWLIITGALLLVLALIIINLVTQRNTPLISQLVKQRYLKIKFKLWDDLKKLDETSQALPLTKGDIKRGFAKTAYAFHKLELNILYLFALLFKSPKDSFLLINCDRKQEDCTDEAFKQYHKKQQKITLFSLYALFLLITANIATGMLVSFVFPEIFKSKADTITHTLQSDWNNGTADSNLDLTTSAGDILLATSSSAVSFTHASQADWEGGNDRLGSKCS